MSPPPKSEHDEGGLRDHTTGMNLPHRELSKEFKAEKNSLLGKFKAWTQEEQIDFIQSLLLKGSLNHHSQVSEFLNCIYQRDFISLLGQNGLEHIVELIFSYLTEDALFVAERVSVVWYRAVADGMLWKKLIERKVVLDTAWSGLAKRRNFMRHLFRPKPGVTRRGHGYYRTLFTNSFQDIERVERRWMSGDPNTRRVPCRSDEVDPSERGVYCLQYDDEKIVSGLRDNTIKIWDMDTLESKTVLRGHTGSVLCLQYDGKVIISGSSDSTLRVWDVVTGALLNTLICHTDAILHLKFEKEMLITCSKVRLLKVNSELHIY